MTEREQENPVSKESLAQFGWQSIILSTPVKSCDAYREQFKLAALSFEKSGDIASQLTAAFLFKIAALMFGPTPGTNEAREPFRTPFRSPGSQSFTQEEIGLITELASQASDPEFKARLADIAFSYAKKRDPQFCQLAIENYILAADEYFTRAIQAKEGAIRIWDEGHTRLMRALQLTAGPKHPLHPKVMAAIEKFLTGYNNEAPLLEIAKTLELCKLAGRLDALTLISWAETFSQRAVKEKAWAIQRRVLTVKAEAQKQAGFAAEAIASLIEAAETYQGDVNDALTRVTPSKLLAAKHLDHQIEALSRLPKTKQRTEELRHLKAIYQKEGITTELITLKYENKIDLDVEQPKKLVGGRTLFEALTVIAKIAQPPNIEETKKKVIEDLKNYPFEALAPLDVYDEEGRIVAKRGCFLGANPEAQEIILTKRIYENLKIRFSLLAQGLIVPAIEQIKEEHNFTLVDIHHLISNGPFVPPGREPLFALGIYNGLLGDFITASHLLAPQLENAIRYQLEKRGIITTVREKEGTERMADINYLFKYKRTELESIFGPDQVVEIECLLIRRFGCNLRNHLSHGRLEIGEMMTPAVVCLWWITLRFCFWLWKLPEDLVPQVKPESLNRNPPGDPGLNPEGGAAAT